ncbi:MAG: hypothetical protein IH977_17050 [Nitrospinae bacterium]|nr:hypothetical protein [Nitrospinota bacterium]
MNAAIEPIKTQIAKKKTALEKLKEQEVALKKLQAEVADIPKLEADLLALDRSLSIIKGEEVSEPTSLMAPFGISRNGRSGSIPNLVYAILKEAGKPLRSNEIIPLVVARGCKSTKQSVLGAVYRVAQSGKLFTLVEPGLFGLQEWSE